MAARQPAGADPRLPPHQACQYAGDFGRGVEGAAGKTVGAVLALRQRRGLRVGRGIGKCIDAGAAHRVIGQRIGVHRDEQRRAVRLRLLHPVVQRNERIARAGQRDPVAALGLQLALQFERGGERHLLLVGAGNADRTRILAAVTGVQHHQRWRGTRNELRPCHGS